MMDLGQHYGTYDFTSCTFISNGTANIIGYAGTTNFNSGATDLSDFVMDMYNTVNVNCDLTIGTFNLYDSGVMNVNQTLIVGGTLTNQGALTNNGTIKGGGVLVQNGAVSNNNGSFIAPGNSPGKLPLQAI